MITVAWDVDDVLNDLMLLWLQDRWLPEHPQYHINFEDIIENPPHKILNCTLEEYLNSLDSFRQSSKYHDMPANFEVLSWFKNHGYKARHIALTAVPLRCAGYCAEWVLRNFGQWIRTFHFVPSLRQGEKIPQYEINKIDYLRWLGKVDILVEDKEEIIRQAQDMGIKGILISRPWNKAVLSLEEALEEIDTVNK